MCVRLNVGMFTTYVQELTEVRRGAWPSPGAGVTDRSCHVGAGNENRVFCKSSKRSYSLSHVSGPWFNFWDRVFYSDLGLINYVRLAGYWAPGICLLCLPQIGISSAHHNTRVFTWCWGSNSGPHPCKASTLPTELASQHFLFNIFFCYFKKGEPGSLSFFEHYWNCSLLASPDSWPYIQMHLITELLEDRQIFIRRYPTVTFAFFVY